MVNDEIDNAKTNRMYKQKLTNQVREYAQHGIWNFKKKECIHQMEQISPIHASKQRVKKKSIPAPNIPFSWIVHHWNEAKNPHKERAWHHFKTNEERSSILKKQKQKQKNKNKKKRN